MGIEPTYSDWQPDALPLCYTRTNFVPRSGIEPPTLSFSEKCSTNELPRHVDILTDYCVIINDQSAFNDLEIPLIHPLIFKKRLVSQILMSKVPNGSEFFLFLLDLFCFL